MALQGIWKTLSKISVGIVLVLLLAWFFIRADQLFPTNTARWKDIILTYILFTAFIFSWNALASKKTEQAIFRVSFLKRLPVLLISIVVSFLVLFAFGFIVKGIQPDIFQSLAYVGIGVLFLHLFVVATLEEFIFRGWLTNELRARGIKFGAVMMIQAIVFALFHYLLSGEWLTILLYIPLGMLFLFIQTKFSPKTNLANIGTHFAWNVFIISGFAFI